MPPVLHLLREFARANAASSQTPLISHVDITPSLLDFGGGFDAAAGAPTALVNNPPAKRKRGGDGEMENPGPQITRYHSRSWVPILAEEKSAGWDVIPASHTFHEIQMYYWPAPRKLIQAL